MRRTPLGVAPRLPTVVVEALDRRRLRFLAAQQERQLSAADVRGEGTRAVTLCIGSATEPTGLSRAAAPLRLRAVPRT